MLKLVIAFVLIYPSATTVCAGVPVTFTAVPINGGASPVYQWKKNGINVGTNSVVYDDNSLNNSDVIRCVLTSSVACTQPATSNSIQVTVNPTIVTTVVLSANPSPLPLASFVQQQSAFSIHPDCSIAQ